MLKNDVPVLFMRGPQDPQVPLGTPADFRRNDPSIDFAIYPDAGQLLFFLKWPDELDRLAPFLNRK